MSKTARTMLSSSNWPIGISTEDAQRFQAPRCATCGSLTQLRWIDVSPNPDGEPRWQLDQVRCLTPGCAAKSKSGLPTRKLSGPKPLKGDSQLSEEARLRSNASMSLERGATTPQPKIPTLRTCRFLESFSPRL